MSRESDLQALQSMKDEIIEIYNLSEQCKKLSDECEELSNKISSPEPFSFKRKPENSEQKLKAVYNQEWENAHKNGGRPRASALSNGICCICIENTLGSIAGNSKRLANEAELYLSAYSAYY